MRVLLALALLLFACDKLTPTETDDAGTEEINPELEREAEELNKLGVERDMLEAKVQITKENLVEARGQIGDAKTKEEKAAATLQFEKAQQEHKSAEAELARFKKQSQPD
jgi:hypothetical protein